MTVDQGRTPCGFAQRFDQQGVTIDAVLFKSRAGMSRHYCSIQGTIDGAIKFEVLLPERSEWNGKLYVSGGGGFNGSVGDNLGRLAQGYATAATDTGHEAQSPDGTWAYDNPVAQENFAHRGLHRTVVTSKALIEAFYGRQPRHSYFEGCSNGGGQAMMETQRYPDDFDGVIMGAPAVWTGVLSMLHMERILYPLPGDFSKPRLSADQLAWLQRTVRNKCDGLDGVTDGLVDNPQACRIDWKRDLPLCSPQGAAGTCFSRQMAADLQSMYEGPWSQGRRVYFGYPLGVENHWDDWIVGSKDRFGPDKPNHAANFLHEAFRNFFYSNRDYDFRTFRFDKDMPSLDRAARLINATDPDLSPFARAGGKIIAYQGWADPDISAFATMHYYEDVAGRMGGLGQVGDFFRLFMVPEMGHCAGGPGVDKADYLTSLERWVEQGIAPSRIEAARLAPETGLPQLTRPLCAYPAKAVYNGHGDPTKAENFTCQVGERYQTGHSLVF